MPLEQLRQLLPEMEELDGLYLALVRASVPDPDTEWDSSRAFATVDKRVLSRDGVRRAVDEAELALREYTGTLFGMLRALLEAFERGDSLEAAAVLVRIGELHEGMGSHRKALAFFERALTVSLPLADKTMQTVALRRIARVARTTGEYRTALQYYGRSANLAADAGDLRGEVIGRTALGHVLALQGRFADAEQCHRDALAQIEAAPEPASLRLEEAQLCNNLGLLTVRQHRLDEAEAWLARARALWAEIPSLLDRAVCRHTEALLREAQQRPEESRALLEEALRLELPAAFRAGIAIDLAESYARAGDPRLARKGAEEAEEYAIAARSPYILGRVYHGRGNIARDTGEEDGFTFYEKALQIAREKGLLLLEGEVLADYAALRQRMGEREEAHSYLERAREIFAELGAEQDQARVDAAMRQAETPPPRPSDA